ncbi:MAG: tetratricopeptide repeat protein [Candidatus Omnitrophota bacterium]|nr:MAG: tetratricopeptide repeat protein [Candidatus Omnitrophota bacterium]
MKAVFLILFFSFCIFIGVCLRAADTDDIWLILRDNDSEVTVYLKSDEIIKGQFLDKTDTRFEIDRSGNSLSFYLDEISKVIESSTGKILLEEPKVPLSTLWKEETKQKSQSKKLIEAGRIYEEQKNYEEALLKYTEAIKVHPQDNHAYHLRYRLYEIMGEDSKALGDLTALIEMGDSFFFSVYLCDRGDIYARKGRYLQAAEDYTDALEIERVSERESIEERRERFKDAGEDEESVDWEKLRQNRDERILMKRGDVYRKMGYHTKALADFTEAIEQNPGRKLLGDCYFLRGLVYRVTNDKRKMRQDWESAESLGDDLVEGTWIAGKKEGPFVWYHLNGAVKAEVTFADDREEGESIWYHENGKIKGKGNYKAGMRDGLFVWYEGAGGRKTKELEYINDKLDGECKWYYDNGNLLERSFFKRGSQHGMSYRYYENGDLKEECPMEDGQKSGTCISYDTKGRIKKKVRFKRGEQIGESY